MEFLHNISEFVSQKKLDVISVNIDNIVIYNVDQKAILPLLRFVKNDNKLRFTILTDLFVADFPNREKRFEIVYSLLSLKLNERVFFKMEIADGDKMESISSIFSAATWYEREAFDMFGIVFKNSIDNRRILTDYGFSGHPLRKDFPLTGHLQVKYDEEEEKVIYEKVSLDQEYRDFDFKSKWEGPGKYDLPDEGTNLKW